jgi:glycosyltransferase involved in cell wall biosynthesis
LKVSLIVSDLAGGGAIRAFLLGQVLRKLNYDIEVVGFLFGTDLYTRPPTKIPVTVIAGKPYPGFLTAAATLLKQINGDLIYAVKPKPTSFGLSLIKKLQHDRPVLLDMDDWELSWYGGAAWQYRPTPKQLYRDLCKPQGQLRDPDHPLYIKWLERWVPQADALTVDTQFLQQRFGGVYLPNGKDTDLFNPHQYDPEISRDRLGLANYRVLMFPGAPRPHKGVEDILIALDQLNQADLRLVIIGGSPYDDYDQQLTQRWGRWIIKLPKQPLEAMPAILAAAHIIVVPQRDTLVAKAQFPLKLTDGMAMAKPILSTQVGDIPEILQNTGFCVKPNSPQQLAERITWIFDHWHEATAKGSQARERCLKYYSVDTMAVTLSQVISGVIKL